MGKLIVSSFYKYVRISRPSSVRRALQLFCDSLGIKGKVIVSREGINGSVSGTRKQVAECQKHLLKDKLFSDLAFKRTSASGHPYRKMFVRLRPEIVTFGRKVDMSKKGGYVTPKLLNRWIKNCEVVLVDARNDYESKIGRFVNAVTPQIGTFSEFPKAVEQLAPFMGKKVVTYCTGGVRCEKASAFLKQSGFTNVFQLKGGILSYIKECPDSYFEGKCFVFDERISIPSGRKNSEVSACELCHSPCSELANCASVKCDKFFVCCSSCKAETGGACSKKCRMSVVRKA